MFNAPTEPSVPPDMLEEVINAAPSLAELMNTVVRPVTQNREALRTHLLNRGYIRELAPASPSAIVGCTDGASVTSPLALGDHHSTLAVAVQERDGAADIAGHRSWTSFTPHTSASDLLAKAVMMTHELELLSTLDPGGVAMLDGSHTTHVGAITDLLANGDEHGLSAYSQMFTPNAVADAIEYALTTETVVAQQKQDSSTAIWDACAQAIGLTGRGLPDKPLAALILEPGEALSHPRCVPSWERIRRNVINAPAESLRTKIKDLVAPVALDGQARVTHLKPHGSDFTLRIEQKSTLAPAAAANQLAAISRDCPAPHMQEPLVQYLADKFAKSISAAASLQLDTACLDIAAAGHNELLAYLTHRYRT